jgi:hypothetical protein
MKDVYGGESKTKLNEWLPVVRSRLFENQETHFILHFSFFTVEMKN